ncbi:nucleotide exchange factor GrpE [Clostridium sp. FP1]|uniref:nucleotide exchange factor GrpE n=1 Tax=Clostridium sp. FP1 TaxID=2724076 RepID=UPI001CCA61FC|nr:nucleotide exchange factor GrpE [Clostridium sp. FP1]MBZ9636103.1 nucleotide exchange factor GrpE [Clostridium sp. FP1]
MHTNNSKNEKILKEEKMPFEDSSLADEIELEETQSNAEEAEIVEEVEPIELLESEKEKDMNKKMKKLQEENTKLENEIIDFKDKFLRTMAEYENFRKRTVKEKEGIYTDACTDVLKEVLPVLDNLERALSVEGCGEDLRTGVEMTVRQFNDAFSKLGVEELPPEGEFDPNFHNAVMHIEDEQYGTNQIVEVFQKGYKRANKVLRHSMVKVAN